MGSSNNIDKRANDDGANKDNSSEKFTNSQRLSLVVLLLVEFLSFCSMSIMAPFYPKEASEKGMSESTAGFVFSFYALVIFISSPIFGKIMPKIGIKFSFMAGTLLSGVMNIIFGTLQYVDDYAWFTTLSFIIRGIEALGASAYSNSTFVLVFELFPHNGGAVRGLLETSVGLGLSAGPAIGGLLYSIGGFCLPFYVVGALILAITPLNLFLIPKIESTPKSSKDGSLRTVLKIPTVFVLVLIIIVVSISWSFIDPTLEPHLRKFDLSPSTIGLIFLLLSATYGIFSPLWGWMVDKIKNYWFLMPLGLLFSGISLLFLGPSPVFVNMEDSIALNIASLSALGIFVAMALMPTYQGLLDAALEGGFTDNVYTQSLISGIWSCVYSLGEVIGPILGGTVLEYWNFPVTATVVAIINFIIAIFATIFFVTQKRVNLNLDCDEKKPSVTMRGSFSSINEFAIYSVDAKLAEKNKQCFENNNIYNT